MIEIPDHYRIGNNGKQLNKKSFAPQTLSTAERRRARDCLTKVTLTHQVAGEDIPSLINEHYHCAVILCLHLELTDIKHKDFISKTIQPLIKPHAVFHMTDPLGNHALSFAHKRLSKTDSNSIVITDQYCSDAFQAEPSSHFPSIIFSHLLNRNNKRDLYLEAMTKALLIDNPKIFIGADALLDARLWYHGDSILQLYQQLTHLLALKQQKNAAKTNATKSTLNTQIKTAISDLKKFLIPNS